MLILQIILTIIAGFRGWGWYAVLPISILFIFAFNFGMIMAMTDNYNDNVVLIMGMLDFALVILLGYMTIKGKNKKQITTTNE